MMYSSSFMYISSGDPNASYEIYEDWGVMNEVANLSGASYNPKSILCGEVLNLSLVMWYINLNRSIQMTWQHLFSRFHLRT
jgi:hypothetical protein